MSRMRDLWLRLFGRGGHLENGPDGHPTPELLTAYHEDRLPPERDDEIQEHLVECEECPELVLEFDRYSSKEMPVMPPEDLSDTRVERAWYQLRRKLTADIVVSRPRWLARPSLAWCVAGLMLFCTVGLGVRVGELSGVIQELEQPQLNPPTATLEPPALTRSAGRMPLEYQVPGDAPQFLLRLVPPPEVGQARYRLEIRTGKGEGVWRGSGLTIDEDRLFVVQLSRRFLPAGEYAFRVLEADLGRDLLVEEYPVKLVYL